MMRQQPPRQDLEPLWFSGKQIRRLLNYYRDLYPKELEGPFDEHWERHMADTFLETMAILGEMSDEYGVFPVGRYFAVPKTLPISGEGLFEPQQSLSRSDSFLVRKKPKKEAKEKKEAKDENKIALAAFGFGKASGLLFDHSVERFSERVKSSKEFIATPSCQLLREILSRATVNLGTAKHAKQKFMVLQAAQQLRRVEELYDQLKNGQRDIQGSTFDFYDLRFKGSLFIGCNKDRKEFAFLPLIDEGQNLSFTFGDSLSSHSRSHKDKDLGTKLVILPTAFSEHSPPDLIPSALKYNFELALQQEKEQEKALSSVGDIVPFQATPKQMTGQEYAIVRASQDKPPADWEAILKKSNGHDEQDKIYRHRQSIWVTRVARQVGPKVVPSSIKFIQVNNEWLKAGGIPIKVAEALASLKSHQHPKLLAYHDWKFVTSTDSNLYASFVTEKIEGTLYQMISLVSHFDAKEYRQYKETGANGVTRTSTSTYSYLTKTGTMLMKFLTGPFMSDTSHALFYLHSRGYAHGDVKPDNIVFVINNNEVNFKLSGSFISKATLPYVSDSVTKVGTDGYSAPEVEYQKGHEAQDIPPPSPMCSDMFSYGMTIVAFTTRSDLSKADLIKDKQSGQPIQLTGLANTFFKNPETKRIEYPGQATFDQVITYMINNWYGLLAFAPKWPELKLDLDWKDLMACVLKMVRMEPRDRHQQVDAALLQKVGLYQTKATLVDTEGKVLGLRVLLEDAQQKMAAGKK